MTAVDGAIVAVVVKAGVGAALPNDEQQGVAVFADGIEVGEDVLTVRARFEAVAGHRS